MGNTMSKLVMVGLVLVAGFVLRGTYEQTIDPSKPAVAQADQYDCASFGSQESAQVELDSDPSDPNNRTSTLDGGWRVSGRVSGKTQRPLSRVAFQHAPCRALSALQHAPAFGC